MTQPAESEQASDPITILIADDEPHIRQVVGSKLRRAGFDVVEASNGQDALALAQEHIPRVIVTDFQMPVMTGYEMSLKLIEDQITADIPIILLTARGHKLLPSELAQTGIRHLMSKPFAPRELLAYVQELAKAG